MRTGQAIGAEYAHDRLVSERFQHVEDDKEQVATASDGNNLATTTFAILGAFDNLVSQGQRRP